MSCSWKQQRHHQWEPSQKASNAIIVLVVWRNHALPIGLIVALHHHMYDIAIAKQSRDRDMHPYTCQYWGWGRTQSGKVNIFHWQNGRHLTDEIFKFIVMNEILSFDSNLLFAFHFSNFTSWLLRVQLMIRQHKFKKWLGIEQATGHDLVHCWPSSFTHICGTKGRWVENLSSNTALVEICHAMYHWSKN